MDKRGYSVRMVATVMAGDPSNPVNKLARHCITNLVTVAYVATLLGVSKASVYNWFLGKTKPNKLGLSRVQDALIKLKVE